MNGNIWFLPNPSRICWLLWNGIWNLITHTTVKWVSTNTPVIPYSTRYSIRILTCLYLPRPSKSSQGHNRHSRLSPSPFRWRNKYKVDALHHSPLPHAATVCFSVFYVCVYLLHTYIYIEREGLWEVEAQCGCGLFWISFTEIVCGGKIFFRRFLLR